MLVRLIGALLKRGKRETSVNLVQLPLLLVLDFMHEATDFFGKAYKVCDNESGNLPINVILSDCGNVF